MATMAIITDAGIIYRDHGPRDGMALLMECPPARAHRSFATADEARAWAEQWLADHPLPPLAPPCPCCGAGEGEAHREVWDLYGPGWQLKPGCTAARAAARAARSTADETAHIRASEA